MKLKELDEQMGALEVVLRDDDEVVIVMPDDPTAIYAVQGVRVNSDQKTLEILVA